MKAHVLTEYNKPYSFSDIPLPALEDPVDMLIRVDAASYCHTDAVLASGTMHPPALPHIGCHEFAGTIVALPSGDESNQTFKLGDRVAVPGRGYHVCGHCPECQNPSGPDPDEPGYSVYCPHAGGGLGVSSQGGFREYAVVDSRQVALIPSTMTAVEVAPLMCAGLTVFAALRKCELQAGQRVGISGCGGGLGHLGLQFATKMGLKTTGIDVAPRALDLARSLGTGATIVDASKDKAEDVRQQTGQEDGRGHLNEMGLDAVLILPESQKSFDYGIKLVRNGGLVVVVSFPPEGFQVSAADLVFRRIQVAKVKTYPFSKLNQLVDDYRAGTAGKLVLDRSLGD
ncbi:alcohol dehydrogenase [Exophiala viscosa]|uniref:Alcohol dehydrogenase n=1 Tax=Exophiala viscosa TaxID=2486360 RepID=A0AAN6IA41_9EURO|nr:alcohol dehydrogenase [Exophiala viscosa]